MGKDKRIETKTSTRRRLHQADRKRKAAKELSVESSADENEADSIVKAEDVKPLLENMEVDVSDSGGDSDKELQIALRDGLLKSDRLNYVVPAKRPIINRTAEMREKISEFVKRLPWIETVDVTTKSTLTEEMINSDFDRELQFYLQAEKAVQIAVPRLLSMGVKVIRPADYYAEMAKTDGHMQKVRKRLLKIKEGKERQEAVRRLREERKYAAKVQKEALKKRSSEKKQLMEAVKKHRKGMKQQLEDMLSNVKRMGLDEDDDVVSRSAKPKKLGMKQSRGFDKKQLKSEKFGYGGKKKGRKRNDKESFEDIREGKTKFAGGPTSVRGFRGRGRVRSGKSRGSRR